MPKTHILQSFGATDVLFRFFADFEITGFQLLNRWMYNVGVSRVQVRVGLIPRLFHFACPKSSLKEWQIVTYDTITREKRYRTYVGLPLHKNLSIFVGRALYMISKKALLVTEVKYVGSDKISKRYLRAVNVKREMFAMASMLVAEIYCTGGFADRVEYATVYRYSIPRNQWT